MSEVEAYFDESGTHAESLVCVVAGVVASAPDWKEFTRDWQRVMERARINTFHATDCANGGGDFKNCGPDERASLYNDVVQLLLTRGIRAVAVVVPTESYSKAFADSPGKPVFPQPYLIGFRHVIDKICDLIQSETKDATVTLTFEMARRQRGRARELAEFLMTYAKTWEHFDRVSGITWATKLTPPLQAADVIAYEIYREMTRPAK
ncbi:MAG TPA: DUF3800 domain-containing protein [Gemmatimonadaceae bacterium]